MPSIRIRNFGPIKEGYTENDGFLDIRKCTVFIGNQGTGKSTVAKVISTMMWVEKQLVRKDINSVFSQSRVTKILSYFNLNGYTSSETIIEYRGDIYTIILDGSQRRLYQKLALRKPEYDRPKVMYVPAERNFLAAVSNAFNIKELPLPLFDFAAEYREAQYQYDDEEIQLPVNTENVSVTYKSENDQFYLVGKGYEVSILESSSGYQSLVPLFVVSRELNAMIEGGHSRRNQLTVQQTVRQQQELENILTDVSIEPIRKIELMQLVNLRYKNECFINIVEEPEQNLFPSSQRALLNSLLVINNSIRKNKLILTTHSPYIITYLSLAVKAHQVRSLGRSDSDSPELFRRLDEVVPENAAIAANDVAIYELKDGEIILLPTYEGIPSDNNYLNESLAEANRLFDELLEIEEALGE